MNYRRLGKTDERISQIGMGTWRIGSSKEAASREEQVAALRRGVGLGMNLIDTAEMYGSGKAEELVGEAIREMRDRVFIATKVWQTNLHRDGVISACEASLKRLGVAQIDLYQVHWPNPAVPIRETMSAMEELVRSGKVRHIGVSNFDARLTAEAQEALTRSEIASNQVEYSLANRGAEASVLPYCRKEGVTLIAYSPLARGSIPEVLARSDVVKRRGMTPAQAMLVWATRDEAVVAIPKAAKVSHVEENAASADFGLSESEWKALAGA